MSPYGMWKHDIASRLLAPSPEMQRMLGVSPEKNTSDS